MLDKLPPELRTNILSRLPVYSLLRCRCVSKSYCAEIDDPKFIKTHFKRSIDTNSNKGMVFADVRPDSIYSVSFDSPDRVVKLDYPLKIDALLSENCTVVGNCDGILCFSNALGRIALINPATRKSQTLPLLPVNVEHNKTKKKLDWISSALGFGYDPIGEDYKVVRLGQSIGRSSGDYNNETMIYNLKSNSWTWRKIPGMSYTLGHDQKLGFLLDYDLHWMVGRDRFLPNPGAFVIVAFNLGTENFVEVPGPDLNELNPKWGLDVRGVSLGTIGNWLSLNSIDCMNNINIYVMKVYGVKESWTKIVSHPHSSISAYDTMRSIPFSNNNGDEYVMGIHNGNLTWWSLKDMTGKLMELPAGVGSDPYTTEVFHGSLVPLNVNTKKPTSKKASGSKGKKINRDEFLSKGFKLKL